MVLYLDMCSIVQVNVGILGPYYFVFMFFFGVKNIGSLLNFESLFTFLCGSLAVAGKKISIGIFYFDMLLCSELVHQNINVYPFQEA